jgi:NAD(P)-dependent dehydrogenase (short-subunit alcohol dehydrogenase family)
MERPLTDVRILLTGVSRGVGLAAARLLLDSGADLIGVARDSERLTAASAELTERTPGRFESVCAELSDGGASEGIAEKVQERWGALDVVVHNAGVMLHHEGGLMSEPDGILQQTLDTNLHAPLALSRSLLPLLLLGNNPRIINVGSGAGTMDGMTEPGIASYRLSKWALHGMTMLQAQELEGQVAVHAFDPGWIRTDLGGPEAPGTPEEAAAGLLQAVLMPADQTGMFVKDGNEISW